MNAQVWRGVRGPRHPPNNRKVMLVCAVSFNRCETLLTETSKFRLKCSKKLVDGSITVKVNWRKRREEASARLMIINQHLRNRGQILSVAMPVIQPAFITDKGLNYMLCHPGFAFNRRWLCFNGVWATLRRTNGSSKLYFIHTDTKKNGKMQVAFPLSIQIRRRLLNDTVRRFPKRLQSSVIM